VAAQSLLKKQLPRRKLLLLKRPRLMLLPWMQLLHPLMLQPTLLLPRPMPLLLQPMLLPPPRPKLRLSKAASKSVCLADRFWKGRPSKAAFLLIGRNFR
jgi:hypothetical protein